LKETNNESICKQQNGRHFEFCGHIGKMVTSILFLNRIFMFTDPKNIFRHLTCEYMYLYNLIAKNVRILDLAL